MAETDKKPPEESQAEGEELETKDEAAESLESPDNNGDSLESPASESSDGSETIDATGETANSSATSGAPKPKPVGKPPIWKRFNIYLLMFGFILIIAGVIVTVAYFQSKRASTTSAVKTQDLTQAALDQLANSDASVGSTQQVLNVKSSAVFAGRVLVREGVEVAGNLQVGGTIAGSSLAISGSSQFGQVQVSKDLSVSGNTAVQGTLTAKSLQVSGGGNFSGPVTAPQITTSNLQLNGDLTITKHIVSGGPNPSRSGGSALGGGGSVSVSGSDTAGTVTINTGGGPPAGCFVTVNFTSRYNSTPRILLTPVGSAGGTIAYYVNRSSTSFSICTSTAPPSGASFGFDYFVIN